MPPFCVRLKNPTREGLIQHELRGGSVDEHARPTRWETRALRNPYIPGPRCDWEYSKPVANGHALCAHSSVSFFGGLTGRRNGTR